MTPRLIPLALLMLAPGLVLAHPGHGLDAGPSSSALAAGLLHPLLGLDHLLAMLGVGLWASQRVLQRQGFGLAGIFLLVLALGFMAGLGSAPGQWIETGILGSVILVGALVALGRNLPAAFGLGLAALFALFHGLAHGAEMGAGLSAPLFAVGFLLSSSALVGLGLLTGRLGQGLMRGPMLVRAGGAGILAAGLVMIWTV